MILTLPASNIPDQSVLQVWWLMDDAETALWSGREFSMAKCFQSSWQYSEIAWDLQ